MASQYQDLLNALFNPYASEIMQAYGYVPSSGTPSITDPGAYAPTGGAGPQPYVPPSGTPGAVFSGGSSPVDFITGGGATGAVDFITGGTTGGGTTGGGTTVVGTPGGSGSFVDSTPYNQTDEFKAYVEADIQNRFGGDRFLHSKRGLVGGEELGPRQTYSLEEFASGILPYAKGKYGSGVTYDPKTGLMYNNITQEELARRRGEDGYARIFGVHPDALTARERELLKLGGHGEMSPGTKYIRIGGPTTGTHYFIENGQVYAYDYNAEDRLGFGGMGPKYGEDNFQTTPVEFNQWIDDLKPSASESTSGADTAQAKQKEVGPSLASELVMEAEEAPQQLTVAAPSPRKKKPADANTMGQFAGLINFPSYSEMLQSNLDVFRNMTAEELMEMNRGRVPPPRISSAAPAAPAGLMGNIEPSPPMASPPLNRIIPQSIPPSQPPQSIPPPQPFDGFVKGPELPELTIPPFGPPGTQVPAAPPGDSGTPAPQPIPFPGAPGDSGTPAPQPIPAPEFTPEQRTAIAQALGAINSGGGFRLPFKNGGPVTSGIGKLFKKEVMR